MEIPSSTAAGELKREEREREGGNFTGAMRVRLGEREEDEEKMSFPFSAFTGTDQIMPKSVLSSAHHWHVHARAFALVQSHCVL